MKKNIFFEKITYVILRNTTIFILALSLAIILSLFYSPIGGLTVNAAEGDAETAQTSELELTAVSLISFQLGEESISLWGEESEFTLFVPSYAELSQLVLSQSLGNNHLIWNTHSYQAGDTLTGMQAGNQYEIRLEDAQAQSIAEFTLFIMQSANLPTMYLNTESGSMEQIWADQENKEAATMLLVDATGTKLYQDTIDYIKGRGNNSWDRYDKKPYQIKLSEDTAFFDMPAAQKWLLIANASDHTLLRNSITRQMAEALELPLSTDGQFIDLYLNGEYAGNYYLCEKIEVSENRLAIQDLEKMTEEVNKGDDLSVFELYEQDGVKAYQIPNNPDDITGGYLIEREFEARFRKESEAADSTFETETGECFEVASPSHCSVEQVEYIRNLIEEAEAAILAEDGINPDTGKSYLDYIDLDSFAKKYLVEEVSMNYDGGVTSSFFYKDSDTVSSLLFAGPVWDYDVTFGNYVSWLGVIQANPRSITELANHQDGTAWFAALCQKPEFMQAVKKYYQAAVSPFLHSLIDGELDAQRQLIKASADMDYIRWQTTYETNAYYSKREDSDRWLSAFLTERTAFLDELWIDNVQYHTVKLMVDGIPYDTLYYQDGEILGALPVVSKENRTFLFWTIAESSMEPHSYMPVYEDMVLNAQFSETISRTEFEEKTENLDQTITYVPEENNRLLIWLTVAVIILYITLVLGIVIHIRYRRKVRLPLEKGNQSAGQQTEKSRKRRGKRIR